MADPAPTAAPAAPASVPRPIWTEEQKLKLAEMLRERIKVIEGALSYKPGAVITKPMKDKAWQEISDGVSAIGPAWGVTQCQNKAKQEKSAVRANKRRVNKCRVYYSTRIMVYNGLVPAFNFNPSHQSPQ